MTGEQSIEIYLIRIFGKDEENSLIPGNGLK
mgnify:CR=1 FL=1